VLAPRPPKPSGRQDDLELLNRILDADEPAANRIAVTVGVSFVPRLQRLRKTVTKSLEMPSGIKPGMPKVGSRKPLKTGLIAAGALAALTAGSAGISSLRRQSEGTTD
jgi:hypothetical protein